MADAFLPYGKQQIDEDDIAAVTAVLRSEFLTTGPAVAAFEEALARELHVDHVVVCSSGTAALHLAARLCDIAPGDKVIVPALTFAASANAFRYEHAEIVFADVDPDTGLMTTRNLSETLERPEAAGARVAVPVHFAGQCDSPADLAAVADRANLIVVEDACHAIGSRYSVDGADIAVGSCRHSTMSVFSFHPVKTIAMGEGGAIATRDSAIARRLRTLRAHGIERSPDKFSDAAAAFAPDGTPNPWYYEIEELGFNYRASDIQCALGRSQLAKLHQNVARRSALVSRYDKLLSPLAPHVRPIARVTNVVPAWHLYVVLIDFDQIDRSRATVMNELRARGIGTQVHYVPVPWHPYYRSLGANRRHYPGAELYYARTLSLPLFPAMHDSDVDRVVEALSDVCR